MANNVDLNGSEYIQNIPGVYFDAISSLVKSVGKDELSSKYIGRIGFGTGTVIDLTINVAKDPDNPGKVIASTIAADGTVYVIGGAAVDYVITEILIGAALATFGVATAPVWLTIAGAGATVVATTYLGDQAKKFLYDTTYNGLNGVENFDFYSPQIVGTVTKDEFIAKSASNDPNFCMDIFPDYINYRQIVQMKSGTESFLYNQLTKDAVITTSQDEEAYEITVIKSTQADKLTINSKTFDIRSLSTLELRNAIDFIDPVSFLLSNITIKVGEKIDMGAKGIYTVQSGDAFSLIAQNNGYTTKQLLELNTWIVDDNRIQFNYPTKVLIQAGAPISESNDQTLTGDANVENILIDHNGGNDTLIGGSQTDHLDGGTGYDTYISGNGDTIEDSDGKGRVFYNNSLLTGGEWNPEKQAYEGNGGTYEKTANGYKFTTPNGETLNLNIPNGSLGLNFTGAPGDDPLPDAPNATSTNGNPNENFSSPLVLDLNHDNTLSTSLYNSQTYFDMDGDGFAEKSAWVQEGDGLLVLDRNANGTRKKIKQEITMAFGNEYIKRRNHVA